MHITIYCKGAPLLSSYGEGNTDSSTDNIHDTVKDAVLPVFLGTKEVGSAVSFEKVTVGRVAMLKYEVNLKVAIDTVSLQAVANGYAGSISGAMWLHGLYPKAIQLSSANEM